MATGCKPSCGARAESASGSAGDADALRQAAVTGHRAINESGTVEQPLRLSCLRAWEAFSVLHGAFRILQLKFAAKRSLTMYLYNSATHKKEEFRTHTPGHVEMYT